MDNTFLSSGMKRHFTMSSFLLRPFSIITVDGILTSFDYHGITFQEVRICLSGLEFCPVSRQYY